MKANVIIWGADNHNSLGLLRQLSNSCFKVYFANIGRKCSCASISKYCTNYLSIPISEIGLNTLINKFNTASIKPVLITSGDGAAEFVDQHKNELSPYFILSGTTEAGLLTRIDNKNEMALLAQRHGFNVPASIPFTIKTIIPKDFAFPAVLKPVVLDNGVSEFKYRRFENNESLEKFKKYLNPNNTYILQRFIPKTNDVLIYGVRLNNGDVHLAGMYIKDRWSDDGGGSHGRIIGDIPGEYNPDGIKSFLEEIDYYGLFSVEYGLENNTPWFYEFNLRNDATSHLFYQGGANLPQKWCFDSLNISDNVETKVKGEHWNINEIYDISNVFKRRLSYAKYRQQLSQADIFYFYDLDDIRPYKAAKRKAIYDIPFRMLLKPMRPYLAWIIWRVKR